ncbi:hypothetical protein [Rhodopseudomonas sp. BR0M22]|uniref:hypothetical protein n=1 Tax=Rhodopseudomonas sp. BR0M22 TaxID=2269369 RepID=UPI0013DFE71D|nr:hypothetical protein [Rhodopseudomonas sp. BR0M22]NEW91379.1 hypothetical protein [Rhodopseudomonas sp. BR0M22]
MSAFRRQWLWPVALAASTVFGLLTALIGEGGLWWLLCWVALATPLVTIALCVVRRRPSSGL